MLCALVLTACQQKTNTDELIVIANTTSIDAINGVRKNVDIIIDGDTISQIKQTDKGSNYKAKAKIIDGRGKYIIPGLWDAHVHLSYDKDIGHEVFFPLSISHGVTYLRDTGGHLEKLAEARKLAKSDPMTPDLYVSGPLLDGEGRVYDGSSPGFPDISVGLSTEKEARDYVDQLASQGVSFVKAYEMLPTNIFTAINDQADVHGLNVAMHIPLSMTAEEAVAAGADDMQHLRNIELSCASNSQELAQIRDTQISENRDILPSKLRSQIHSEQRSMALPNYDEYKCRSLMKLLAQRNVFQTPTLTISRFFSRRLFEDETFRQSFDHMPAPIAEQWSSRSNGLKDRPASPADIAYDNWILKALPMMAAEGVPIMAGTDAPIAFLTPGASLHEEMILLVDAGLTPMQALRAATYEPARFLGLEKNQGSIDIGMKADLVILNNDPVADIKNIKNVDAVVKNGVLLDRDDLNELLQP